MARVDSPITIGKKVCKNRVTMAPTVKFSAGEDGKVTKDFVKHYEERAAHKTGLIVVEATCVAKDARLFPGQLGLWNENRLHFAEHQLEVWLQHYILWDILQMK